MVLLSKIKDVLTISSIESMVKGNGWEQIKQAPNFEPQFWRFFQVWKENENELWIIRPDGLRRAWTFKLGSIIEVGEQSVRFKNEDVIDELSVDEDAQTGEKPKPKLPPKN